MKKLIKMPSIPKLDTVVRDIQYQARYLGSDEDGNPIYDEAAELPVLTFTGTCKLHGSNGSVAYNGKELWAQSKGNIITPEKDNYGFASFVERNKHHLLSFMTSLRGVLDAEEVVVYGEWAGKGIQAGVAIAELPKAWYMFGVKFKTKDEEEYQWLTNPQDYLIPMKPSGMNKLKQIVS